MVTGVIPFPPRFLPSIFFAHRVQQSHCSSIFHRVLLTHALALSASQFVHKKKSQRTCTRIHSGGFELTKLTYTRLEDYLIRHRGDRLHLHLCDVIPPPPPPPPKYFKTPPSPHQLVDLQDSINKLMHFLPQLSDFVPLTTSFIVSAHRLTNITLLTLIATP